MDEKGVWEEGKYSSQILEHLKRVTDGEESAQVEHSDTKSEIEPMATTSGHNPLPDKTLTAKMAATWLRRAADLIDGDRQDDYGDFLDNSKFAAGVASISVLEAIDAMIGYKKSRLNNTPTHEDSIVDLIGYYALREAVRVRLLSE